MWKISGLLISLLILSCCEREAVAQKSERHLEEMNSRARQFAVFFDDFSSASIATKPSSSVIYESPSSERMVQNVSITQADDGTLVAAWSNKARERHDNDPTNQVMVSRSGDDGRTWSEPQVVDSVFSINPTFLKVPGGEIWLFYDKNNSTTQDDTSIHYRRSSDGGKTWSEDRRLETGYRVEVIVHNGIVLSNGDWLITFHYDRASKDKPFEYSKVDFAAGVMISIDQGRTWRLYGEIEVPNLLGAPNIKSWAVEPAVVETKDGRLLMFLRTNTGLLYKAVSYDKGRNWLNAKPMVFSNPNSKEGALTLADGNIVLFWNDCRIVDYGQKRFPLMASLSEDGGDTWAHTVTIDDDQTTLGYPSVIEVKGGLRLVYDYQVKQARFVKLREDDVKKRWTIINRREGWKTADGVLRMTDDEDFVSPYEWTKWSKTIAFLPRKPTKYSFESDFRFDGSAFSSENAAVGLFSGYQDEDNWLAWVWYPSKGLVGIERQSHFGLTKEPTKYRQSQKTFFKNLRPETGKWYRVRITQDEQSTRWELRDRESGRLILSDRCLITNDSNFIALGTLQTKASFDNIRVSELEQ